MPVLGHRGAVSIVSLFLYTLHKFLLIIASQPSSQSFPREINDILLFDGQICAVLLDVDILCNFIG